MIFNSVDFLIFFPVVTADKMRLQFARKKSKYLKKKRIPKFTHRHTARISFLIGMAPGVERMLMLLRGEENIREVTAFPMSGSAQDLMCSAPGVPL